jgi:hypothetical protein
VQALQVFVPAFGEHDTGTVTYGPDGRPSPAVRGYERVFPKGITVICDRGSEDGYEDLMVYHFDQDANALKGFLFMPLPKPRVIDVAVQGNVITLTYPPLTLDGQTIVSRETVTIQRNGSFVRRVDRRQPDGTFKLVRTVTAGPSKQPQQMPPGPQQPGQMPPGAMPPGQPPRPAGGRG